MAEWLGLFRELRVYYRQGEHYSLIQERVKAAFPAAVRVETLSAELCRAELLVEIEGMAVLPAKA
jgi:hypothetical protein